ncbi:MAG TPA: recombinase family protein, partial [Fimbriiglobus sp.]|nr:recombinase family protein [Fimbriiglobus sp.]
MATETVYGYSYARFSHPSQAAGDSLRRQTDGTAAWCKAHGVVYDPSLCLVDAGLSGFRRDDLAVYALGEFLGHVKSGRVPKGSYLVMENLDRLSREEEVVALNLFTSILVAGIKIVTLTPDEVYDKHSDLGQVMKAILELSRGHSESQRKSSTCGPAWREKKERARRERGYVMTKTVPGWIRVGDKGRLELIPERAKVVKQIFELALSGLGVGAIARQLNALGVASWRSTRTANRKRPESRCWDKTAVRNVLTSQAACGVYQPHVGSRSRGRTRPRPIGAPIPNYYPAAVRRQLYDAVQGLRAKRLNKG